MAERRMFSQKITESDAFTTLPPTTQCLYFHLCMNADDDGFSNKIRQAMFNAHADQNDFEMLIQKRFILPFDSGVIVIKHWRMHNLIRSDRYHETNYIEEKATLILKKNGIYSENTLSDNQMATNGIPSDNQMATEVRLGKDSIDEDNIVSENRDEISVYKEIIDYLNTKTGKKFRWQTSATQKSINGRVSEGYTIEDFKKVIDNKVADWADNPKMSKFLTPETLFRPSHFESYLNQTEVKSSGWGLDEEE